MREPERLSRSRGLGSTLLASAKGDRVPDGATRRVLGSATVVAALATKASTSAAAVASAASALPTMARIAGWKWLAVGLAGAGAVSAGAVTLAPSKREPAKVRVVVVPDPVKPPKHAAPVIATPAPSATVPPPPPAASTPPAPPASPQVALTAATAHATASPAPPQSRLPAEIAAIDDAKKTLAAGDPASALGKLDAYDAAFPRGTLAAEASALRIEALVRSGRTEEARGALRRFRESYPASPLLEGLTRAVGE